MMKIRWFTACIRLVISLAIFLHAACTKELDYDISYEGDRLFVQGIISPRQGIQVNLTHTLPPTGKYTLDDLAAATVNSADVFLLENGQVILQLEALDQSGNYTSPGFVPEFNKAYSLLIEAPDFPSVSTQDVFIPSLPSFSYDFVEVEEPQDLSGLNGPRGTLQISWQDQMDSTYYQIQVEGMENGKRVSVPIDYGTIIQQDESCGVQLVTNDRESDVLVFPDFCFKNQNFTAEVEVALTFFDTQTRAIERIDELEFVFQTTSKSYYEYLTSIHLPEGLELAFVEPPLTATNIKGGYGFFAAVNSESKRITIP